MGPRFGALGVPEPLLPWHAAGVRYLLRAEAPAGDVAGEAPEDGVASQASDNAFASRNFAPGDTTHAASTRPFGAAPVDPAWSSPETEPRQGAASPRPVSGGAPATSGPASSAARPPARPPVAQERSASAGADRTDADRASPPEAAGQGSGWPEPWDAFLAKTCQPCSALFVYQELGFDLAGQASPERRALFADILGALRNKAGWPRGCVSFWPLGVPAPDDAASLAVDTDMFWRGVARIKPRFVCLFGRAAWQTLYPGRRFIIGPLRASGHSLLVLPGPEEMLPDNKQVKGVVWNSLRSLGISG